ncbi:MAG: hypothetical protein ACKO46_06140 [Alphaproteobacteria bacterium]
MTSAPSNSPSSPTANQASFSNFQRATNNKINFYCQDPTFKERFDKLSKAIEANNAITQPIKLIFGTPVLAGFFANFMALYLLLKIYTAAESDRVRFPGSPYAQTRPPAIGSLVDKFEDVVSSAFKICGYEIEPLRNKSYGDEIEWTRIHQNSEPVGFLDNNHNIQAKSDIKYLDDYISRQRQEMVV